MNTNERFEKEKITPEEAEDGMETIFENAAKMIKKIRSGEGKGDEKKIIEQVERIKYKLEKKLDVQSINERTAKEAIDEKLKPDETKKLLDEFSSAIREGKAEKLDEIKKKIENKIEK